MLLLLLLLFVLAIRVSSNVFSGCVRSDVNGAQRRQTRRHCVSTLRLQVRLFLCHFCVHRTTSVVYG